MTEFGNFVDWALVYGSLIGFAALIIYLVIQGVDDE